MNGRMAKRCRKLLVETAEKWINGNEFGTTPIPIRTLGALKPPTVSARWWRRRERALVWYVNRVLSPKI